MSLPALRSEPLRRVGPRRLAGLRSGLLMLLLLGLPCSRGFDVFKADLALTRELNRMELYDFAMLQLELMQARHPGERQRILIEQARTFYAAGKSSLGDETVAKIKPGSPFYNDAVLLKGEVAARRRKFETAEKAFAQYFQKVKPPKNGSEQQVEDFKRAVALYSFVLKQRGKGKEAARIIGLLGQIRGEGAADDRQMTFLRAQAFLDAAEEKLDKRENINTKSVRDAMKTMESLQFTRDGVAAASFVERVRAMVILGGSDFLRLQKEKKTGQIGNIKHFVEAVKLLNMAAELLEDVERAMGDGGGRTNSPMAGALFYKGKALKGQSLVLLVTGRKDKARKVVAAAGKYFETVVSDYGESPYRMRALAEHGKCAELLEKQFGRKLELTSANVDAELDLKLEQAAAFLQDEKYEDAIPIYTDALRLGRRSKRLPDVAVRLVICYGQTDRFLEAEALVSYLVDVLPDSEGTADCLFRLGGAMYERAKTIREPARKNEMFDRAMTVWGWFVEAAPLHPKAPDVAFVVAEHRYKVASDLAKQSQTTQTAADRERFKTRARDAYLAAVPAYQRLVNHYGSHEKGVRALYKLGWIHYSTDESEESIESFLRYFQEEARGEHSDDRLQARFRAAEQMMLGENPADAVDEFKALLALYDDASDFPGLKMASPAARRLKEDAASYLAWSYDLCGETYRGRLTRFREARQDAEQARRQAESIITAQEQRLETLEKERAAAKTEFAELVELLKEADTSAEERALAEATRIVEAKAGKLDQLPAEERAIAEQQVETEAKRQLAGIRDRTVQGLEGARLSREAERDEIKTAQQNAAERILALDAKLLTQRGNLDAAKDELTAREKQLADLRAKIEGATKAVSDAEARKTVLDKAALDAREAALNAPDAQAKAKAVAEIRRIEQDLQATMRRSDEAHAERDRIVTPEADDAVSALVSDVTKLRRQAAAAEKALRDTQRQREVAGKEVELLQVRLQAVAKALEHNREVTKRLAADPAQTEETAPEVKRLASEVQDGFRKVKDIKIERLVLLQNAARERIAVARQEVSAADAEIADLNEQQAPVQAAFDDWKTKAQGAFAAFLKDYPKSKHVPDNLGRLGTIYLEMGEFERAAGTLKSLATDHPRSEAGRDALFSLGRAQCETGDYAAARETFDTILKNPDRIASPNLSFIAERMLENGQPETALAASEELIRRSETDTHPDYELLRRQSREPALFRAGRAAAALGQHDRVIELMNTILEENERSGYFFEVKFATGLARLGKTPPDLAGAERDFGEILQYADDQTVSNRALCLLGETYVLSDAKEKVQSAAARFQQIVMLADPSLEDNLPWIERAIVGSAKAFARLGKGDERDRMVQMYREKFPNGQFAQQIGSLPAQEF